jgi:hypothetical protein
MPRVTPLNLKRKPIAYSCLYDRGVYEVYADNVLMSSHETKRDAQKEASRLRKPRPCHLHITVSYKSVCTWGSGSDICKYWKSCVDAKGTTFTQPWGKKKLMLLEMKRQAKQLPTEPKKDKESNQFF